MIGSCKGDEIFPPPIGNALHPWLRPSRGDGGEVFAVDDRVAIGKGVEIKKENEDV
jgi:hypothetical protein